MPVRTIVTVIDLNTMTVDNIAFTKMSEAAKYVKSYPCRGHVLFAKRYSCVVAYKSDSYGFRQL